MQVKDSVWNALSIVVNASSKQIIVPYVQEENFYNWESLPTAKLNVTWASIPTPILFVKNALRIVILAI